jgi:hypothetical protein
VAPPPATADCGASLEYHRVDSCLPEFVGRRQTSWTCANDNCLVQAMHRDALGISGHHL